MTGSDGKRGRGEGGEQSRRGERGGASPPPSSPLPRKQGSGAVGSRGDHHVGRWSALVDTAGAAVDASGDCLSSGHVGDAGGWVAIVIKVVDEVVAASSGMLVVAAVNVQWWLGQ